MCSFFSCSADYGLSLGFKKFKINDPIWRLRFIKINMIHLTYWIRHFDFFFNLNGDLCSVIPKTPELQFSSKSD